MPTPVDSPLSIYCFTRHPAGKGPGTESNRCAYWLVFCCTYRRGALCSTLLPFCFRRPISDDRVDFPCAVYDATDPWARRDGQPHDRPKRPPNEQAGLLGQLPSQARPEGHAFRLGAWRQGAVLSRGVCRGGLRGGLFCALLQINCGCVKSPVSAASLKR